MFYGNDRLITVAFSIWIKFLYSLEIVFLIYIIINIIKMVLNENLHIWSDFL